MPSSLRFRFRPDEDDLTDVTVPGNRSSWVLSNFTETLSPTAYKYAFEVQDGGGWLFEEEGDDGDGGDGGSDGGGRDLNL